MAEKDGVETIPVNAQPESPLEENAPEAEPELLAGKFKSADELANAYSELETRFGKQGSELGDLRKTVNTLTEQMTNAQKGTKEAATAKESAFDYQAQVDEIYRKVDNGELSVEEALRDSNALTAQLVEQMASQKTQAAINQARSESEAETIKSEFLKDHPDFYELQQSGALEEIKATSPLHDDFSAYFALKAAQAKEEGKKELERLMKGADPAAQAAMGSGAAIRQTNTRPTKPLSSVEMRQSMMGTLAKVRGAST
jgi:hypothetical protein